MLCDIIEPMKKASNVKWTIEKIKKGFEAFYSEHGRYPTAIEVDLSPKLPSSRQIQRSFGGLPAIRELLKLKGQTDFTKGKHSSDRAYMINKRAHKVGQEVYEYLVGLFGKPFVHREFFFNDDRRTRTDFYIYYDKANFSVDVFYPGDARSMATCLNSKLNSYKAFQTSYPTVFLVMNDSISEDKIKRVLENKKNKLRSNQAVMTFDQFKTFCKTKGRA